MCSKVERVVVFWESGRQGGNESNICLGKRARNGNSTEIGVQILGWERGGGDGSLINPLETRGAKRRKRARNTQGGGTLRGD